METKKDYVFIALNVISWIIFIGLCFNAGAYLFNAFFTLFYNPFGEGKLWDVMNLSELYNYNQSYYVTIASLIIITAVLKALMFYLIVKIFHDKKFDLSHPFNEPVRKFIVNIAWLALGIGLFSYWGAKDTENFVLEGVNMPDIQHLNLGGADVWLFMGVALLVIGRVFKKGIEIQNEIDLTV
ncbi:MAG TPA: hypothetical protein DER09_13785 [Prolixibacteraceae bacterium]|nr:hypothetical protein [Prolixibacteraceae bacterium]